MGQIISLVLSCARRCLQAVLSLRKSELHSIVSSEFNIHMAVQVSRMLKGLHLKIHDEKSLDQSLIEICRQQRIIYISSSHNMEVNNLRRCLTLIGFKHQVRMNIEAQMSISVQWSSHEQALNDLWSFMRPNVRRSSDLTDEWGEIGFQGKDPTTDFRGMGSFALAQLTWFSKHKPTDAQKLLLLMNDPACYLPFAVTAINFSKLVYDFIVDGTLDRTIFSCVNDIGVDTFFDKDAHSRAAEELNLSFSILLTNFGERHWRAQRPAAGGIGAMAYPLVFRDFRTNAANYLA